MHVQLFTASRFLKGAPQHPLPQSSVAYWLLYVRSVPSDGLLVLTLKARLHGGPQLFDGCPLPAEVALSITCSLHRNGLSRLPPERGNPPLLVVGLAASN